MKPQAARPTRDRVLLEGGLPSHTAAAAAQQASNVSTCAVAPGSRSPGNGGHQQRASSTGNTLNHCGRPIGVSR